MCKNEIKFYLEGEEYSLPAKFAVCDDCEGEGKHMRSSMRDIAYTPEEFHESFSEEEQDLYFGGGYDVTCESCKGKRVVLAVDYEACNTEEKELYSQYLDYLEEREMFRMERESERRMGA